jgi:hypothetical protein
MDELSALMCDRWQIAKLAKLGLLHRCRRRVGPDGSAFRRTVFELRSHGYVRIDKSYYVKRLILYVPSVGGARDRVPAQ